MIFITAVQNIEKIDKLRKKYGMYNAIAPEKIENLSKMDNKIDEL